MAPLFDRDREVVQLHFGGGTPNFLTPAQLARAGRQPRAATSISRAREPAISPSSSIRASSRDGDIAAYAAMGFNRASLGVQDFDPAVQLAVNRDAERRGNAARHRRLPHCRLPLGQRRPDLRTAEADARRASRARSTRSCCARPDRIAVYGYAHLPQTVQGAAADRRRDLPDAAEQARRCCSWRSSS